MHSSFHLARSQSQLMRSPSKRKKEGKQKRDKRVGGTYVKFEACHLVDRNVGPAG